MPNTGITWTSFCRMYHYPLNRRREYEISLCLYKREGCNNWKNRLRKNDPHVMHNETHLAKQRDYIRVWDGLCQERDQLNSIKFLSCHSRPLRLRRKHQGQHRSKQCLQRVGYHRESRSISYR